MIMRLIDGGLRVLAPAKINLFLEVMGRRSDGYHELETLMVAIDFHDALELRDDPSGRLGLKSDAVGLATDATNLVTKAAVRLREEAVRESKADRAKLGAMMVLEKSIPMGAGLGGGSSDAAAALAGLNRLWGLGFDNDRLTRLAGEVGSDVAFFAGGAPVAVCRGRGERVEPERSGLTLHFVLISPHVHVSTESVYRALTLSERPRSIEPMRQAVREGAIAEVGRLLFNRLEPVAERLRPELVPVRKAIENASPSPEGVRLSGSGSTYFGLYRDPTAASDAARRLDDLGLGRVRVAAGGVSISHTESAT